MLSAGIKAPDFTLKDKDGKEVKLSSFLAARWYCISIQRITRPDAPGGMCLCRRVHWI